MPMAVRSLNPSSSTSSGLDLLKYHRRAWSLKGVSHSTGGWLVWHLYKNV